MDSQDFVSDLFARYLRDDDLTVKNNANTARSVGGLNLHLREAFTREYCLTQIYPAEIATAHRSGALHLHDLGFFGPYCAGWDLHQLLILGFTGVPGKVSAPPARTLHEALNQIVNATFTLQGETAGAQAWSSFDTYLAPFVRHDGLSDDELEVLLREFVFNLNVATRSGFQCPFSNLTLDVHCPVPLRETPVVIGGALQETTYGDYQAEIERLDLAFCRVMLAGDGQGRAFTFPIPTINITRATDWQSSVMTQITAMAAKYGIPYFANYINADLRPEDAVSMCCRLRLDVRELRKRGGGLFGSNPLTGSIGVVTLNLPRLGYQAVDESDFFVRLEHLADLAKDSLEIKRRLVEAQTAAGLYPYSAYYLQGVKQRTGNYWYNHFSTIGIVGMQECLLNLKGVGLDSVVGQQFAVRVMHFLRDKLRTYQESTGHVYNLEATPAETVASRFARLDQSAYPQIITAGTKQAPYYTNSTQLPVGYTDDIFRMIELQDELQSLYTGGTVVHLYTGEKLDDIEAVKRLIQKVFARYRLPYLSITPTFSICPSHGYLPGEQWRCQHCGAETEVWSRVVGFLRPVANYHAGKRQEYLDRKKYRLMKTE
ncbi:MAG: ribonucleoside triphosphate reductase [Eubacteriales bacterium]|nr:ribonucleoside triphosphate reductase [Eubacteriales bacterium]